MNLLPGLKTEGIDCELLCVCPPGTSQETLQEYYHKLNERGIKTTVFTSSRPGFLAAAAKINRYLRKEGISIVHSHLINSDLLAVLTKKFFYRKLFIISSKHGYDENYLVKYKGRTDNQKPGHNLYYYVTKFLQSAIDVNLAVSESMAHLYKNAGLTKSLSHHIHHGITEPVITVDTSSPPYRVAHPQLVIAGRLAEMKGHRYLFEAMPLVLQKFPAAKLLVLGQGPDLETLQQLAKKLNIADKIDFLGFKPDPYNYIVASDVIILPSLFEPFGLVYIEAFAIKKPVVAFDVEATNEVVKNNETGLLVPKGDSKALAEKIIHLLEDPSERKRLTDNAYKAYLDHYNSQRMIKETAEWYRSLVIN